jgi:hypothetical protein
MERTASAIMLVVANTLRGCVPLAAPPEEGAGDRSHPARISKAAHSSRAMLANRRAAETCDTVVGIPTVILRPTCVLSKIFIAS